MDPKTSEIVRILSPAEPERWAGIVGEVLGPMARGQAEALARNEHEPERFARRLRHRLDTVDALLRDPDRIPGRVANDTDTACAVLDALRAGPAATVLAERLPLLAALAEPASRAAAVEHEGGGSGQPLLDHLSVRVLDRKLRGLELGRLDVFQRDGGLSVERFALERQRLQVVSACTLLPVVRAALLHLDFAKGGSREQRARWSALPGVDLGVHNEAAAAVLAAEPVSPNMLPFPATEPLFRALVATHGVTGQIVRGESPLSALAPWVEFLHGEELSAFAGVTRMFDEPARNVANDLLHLINVCDTAGVREGLLDDALAQAMERRLVVATSVSGSDDVSRSLAVREMEEWHERVPGAPPVEVARRRVADRLIRLRAGRAAAGEPPDLVHRELDGLPDDAVLRLQELLSRCYFWYAESGSAELSPAAQLKLLLTGASRAARSAEERGADRYHVSLLPLVEQVGAAADERRTYRVRVMEALLADWDVQAILAGGAPEGALGRVAGTLGGLPVVCLSFEETEEATALLTLLSIYERKSVPAFHSTLKTLTDLYGLRKDEFDRVANEAAYLRHMNQSRTDKARMLDFVRPGRIVEVGPGGGVVLDLLVDRFPEGEVVGVDTSATVAESLRARKAREGLPWSVVHGDAFNLPDLFPAGSLDSVVFCSVLHEIYSYVEWPPEGGERFRLESVRAILQAAWRALGVGGRIVIRDGVMPPRDAPPRRLIFLTGDGMETLELFAREFEGREVAWETVAPDTVELAAEDAMEFLYTYVWGPESFPYEVREQYGVLPYDEYRASIVEWLNPIAPVRTIDLDPADRTYLQPGYARRLGELVRHTDVAGQDVRLPDSNALWVFEKRLEVRHATR